MPQVDEKTETYLLTNKGMEKKDFSKEVNPEVATGAEVAPGKRPKEQGGSPSRMDGSMNSPANLHSKKGQGDADNQSNAPKGRRLSYKSYNQSHGNSQLDLVAYDDLE